MKTATQFHAPPHTTFELTFDLQRFDEFDIKANDQTVTLTDGADTIYIKASAFTGDNFQGSVTLNGTFGKDDKIIVYLNDKTDGKDVFDWTSRNLPSDNSAEIYGAYNNGDTQFDITVNGVARSTNLNWSDIDANHSATVAVTVDYLNRVDDNTQAAFAIATDNRNSSTLTGINSTAGITYDVDSWCFTIPTANIYVTDSETHGTVNLSGEGNLAVTGDNVAENLGGLKRDTANNKVTLKTAGYGVGYYVNNGDGGRTISYNATPANVETLLELVGIDCNQFDYGSIDGDGRSISLYSEYLIGDTVTVSNNSGGYRIYIGYGDWSGKTLNYVVTGDANIYCGEFNGKLNFIDANGNLLEYTKKVSGYDVVLTVGDKSITLEDAMNLDTLNINGATVSTSPFEVDSDDNRLIKSAEDLINFSTYVTNGHTCEGLTFKLTANIDMTGKDFTPIGSTWNEYASFKGTFDGAGHTISGLNISDSEYSNVGLFRFNFGTIKNLNVSGTVKGTYNTVGGIVGSNRGTLDNVTFSGTVGNASYVGGLVGQNIGGTVKNSTFSGTVSGYDYVGGLIGFNGAGTITDNKVDAQITGNSNVGALVGATQNTVTSSGNYFHSNQTAAFGATENGGDEIQGMKVLYKVTLQGFTAEGAAFTIGNNAYTNAELTLATKTGYLFGDVQSKVTVTKDTTISATFDTAKHYAFKSGDTYTLATADNTADYPDLVQVYQLTLPQGVTVEGSIVITDNGKTYASGEVKIEPAKGYTLDNIMVNGKSSGDTFTVNGDTNIAADVTAIVTEDNEFNKAGTAVIVKGTTGDFHANSTLYSITAAQRDSHIIANAKANQIIVAGGNENILTGGKGNDTFKFKAGGGIVTDYGIGATKSGDGKALSTASGTDIVKVDGKVTGIYFDRDASSKKSAFFTATIVYNDGDADQVVVLKDIAKKPTKTGKSPIYQTNDVAAATLKIWDTSSGKQSVLSATKLKKFFCDDDSDAFTEILQTKTNYLVDISKGNTPENNPFDVTATPSDGEEISGVEDD